MKSPVLFAFFLFATMGFAQSSKRDRKRPPPMHKRVDMSAENIAILISKKMTLQLDLSEAQQAKVYDLILVKAVQKKIQRENRPDMKISKEMYFEMRNKRLDDKIAFSKALKSILNDTQYSLWKQQKQMKKKRSRCQ